MKRDVGSSPTRRSVPGPSKCSASNAQRGQPRGGARQHVLALAPGRHRVVLVQTADVQDALPELRHRLIRLGVGEDERGPWRRRARHRGPVRRARVDDLGRLAQEGKLVAAGPRGIEVAQHAGHRRPGQPDARRAQLAEREHPLAVPRRHVVERVLGGVQDARALDLQVEQLDVDELRARAVGALGDRPREVELARLGRDRDDLPRLHVGGEVDDEVRVALEDRGARPARAVGRRAVERQGRGLGRLHKREGTRVPSGV